MKTDHIQAQSIKSAEEDPTRYYHGTKADLKTGELIGPGFNSNYGKRKKASYVYLTATLEAATWGAELAAGESECGETVRSADPTKSYRSKDPIRITG